MGWYGAWKIEYKGKNKDKFLNLAKMIIPNYGERFEEENGVLNCTRSLSWYSADRDIEEIASYLDEGDEIHVSIDGESHPIASRKEAEEAGVSYEELEDEDDDYYGDYYEGDSDDEEEDEEEDDEVELEEESQVYIKRNGKVEIKTPFEDDERWKEGGLGNADTLSYAIAYGKIDELKDVFAVWANVMVGNQEMLEIGKTYLGNMLKYLNVNRYNDYNLEINKDINKIVKEFKASLASTEKLSEFLEEYKGEERIDDDKEPLLPETEALLKQMNPHDVLMLGGKEMINKMVSMRGLADARNTLKLFGYLKSGANEYDDYENE